MNDLFKIVYGGYEYLRDLNEDIDSSSYKILEKIKQGDIETISYCLKKIAEEQQESYDAINGKHIHNGLTQRETVINEIQQSLYWAILISVGRFIKYEEIKFLDFVNIGLTGKNCKSISKDEITIDLKQHNDIYLSAITVIREAIIAMGYNIFYYNSNSSNPITIDEIAKCDLKQMMGKSYLLPYILKTSQVLENL